MNIEQMLAQSIYFSSTESMIPWEWIQESKEKRFLMTEHERVSMLLGAVNGASFTVREWEQLCGAPLGEQGAVVIRKDGKMPDLSIPLFAKAKAALRSALTAIIEDADDSVGPTIGKNLREILRLRVLTIPDESNLGLPCDRVIAHSPGAALAYAIRLVLDPAKPFRRRLRQCKYADCGDFALVSPATGRGKPRGYFCSEEHDAQHAKQQDRERKRKQRSRAK